LDFSNIFATSRVTEALLGNIREWIASGERRHVASNFLSHILLKVKWQFHHSGEGSWLDTIDLQFTDVSGTLARAVFTLKAAARDRNLTRRLTEAHFTLKRKGIAQL
jgi:hypothetical protein